MENANLQNFSNNRPNPLHNPPLPLQNDIFMFRRHNGESFPDAWTRFKYLLKKVLHHGLDLLFPLQIFYTRIDCQTQQEIENMEDGKMWDYGDEEAWEIFEILAQKRSGTCDPKMQA